MIKVEKKKSDSWFFKVLLVLFLLYISLTIAIEAGYYEAKLSEKTTITEEAMEQFEQDVKEGKDVDITDYVSDIHKDYSNSTTKAGVAFSGVVESFMSKGINEIVNIFKMLFT